MRERRQLLLTVASFALAFMLAAVIVVDDGLRLRDGESPLHIAELVIVTVLAAVLVVAHRARLAAHRRFADGLMKLASTDDLTGLANRRAFLSAVEKEIARCLRYRRTCALLVWDLNGFKALNDRLGHLAGDRVLRIFASALESSTRRHDTAARPGGDEFAALLPEGTAEGAEAVNRRLQEQSAREWEEVEVSAAFGFAVFPADGRTLDELFAVADHRMYADKNARRAWLDVGDGAEAAEAESLHDRSPR